MRATPMAAQFVVPGAGVWERDPGPTRVCASRTNRGGLRGRRLGAAIGAEFRTAELGSAAGTKPLGRRDGERSAAFLAELARRHLCRAFWTRHLGARSGGRYRGLGNGGVRDGPL